MKSLTRRRFVQTTLAAGAALALPSGRVLGANEDVRLGFIGLGGRGSYSVDWFSEIEGVRVVALAEPDRERLEAAQEKKPEAAAYTDFRELLDRDDVDAVVISAPVHWHALLAIRSMEAGKDVYLEKPFSHNVWEGQQVLAAARKHDRLVQIGTQQRSDVVYPEVKEFLRSGEIGDIQYVRAVRFGQRASIGRRSEPMDPPSHVDYDLWLGPAQDEPIYREEFQYDWHWVWNTGAGEVGNWGPHILDDVYNLALDDPGPVPHRCVCAGGRVGWDDAGDTPNVFVSYFETASVPVVLEMRNLPTAKGVQGSDHLRGTRNGHIIQCEGGYYAGGRGGGTAYDANGDQIRGFDGDGGGSHAQNFIDALRSGRREDLKAEVGTIFPANTWCHLANATYRLGQSYDPDEARERVSSFEPWREAVESFHEHLEANEVDLAEADLQLSGVIEIDPETQALVGEHDTPEARALLRREYREPYVVEEQ